MNFSWQKKVEIYMSIFRTLLQIKSNRNQITMDGINFLFTDYPSKSNFGNRRLLQVTAQTIFLDWTVNLSLPDDGVQQYLINNRTNGEIEWVNDAIRKLYKKYQHDFNELSMIIPSWLF